MPICDEANDCLRVVPINSAGETAASIDKDRVFRDAYHEDVARIVHSPSFRRLHRKRQLLPYEESDFVRTRSSHSNEVAQIATSIGAHLNNRLKTKGIRERIKADLLVFAGLVHDLGHPPFGHLGEKVLNEKMIDAGGFEGNAQTLRIITKLERRFSTGEVVSSPDGAQRFSGDSRSGINPTLRSIASILKYCELIEYNGGEKPAQDGKPKLKKGYYSSERAIVNSVIGKISKSPLDDERRFKTIEADIMDFADDIAYSIYDLEDCFRMRVLSPNHILGIDGDKLSKIASDVRKKIAKRLQPFASDEEIESAANDLRLGIDEESITQVLS